MRYQGNGEGSGIIQAAHCADLLIAEFLNSARQLPTFENTVFLLLGDHLMHETLLYLDDSNDRIFGALLNAGRAPTTIDSGTTHMDIAPTLLGVAAVQTNATFLDGSDILGEKRAIRDLDFLTLPPAVAEELGARNYLPSEGALGIVYKHSLNEATRIVNERHLKGVSLGRDINVYVLSTKNPKFVNQMVLVEAPGCDAIGGTPIIKVTYPGGATRRLRFSTPKAGAFMDPSSQRCGRLLSFFIRGERPTALHLEVGSTQATLPVVD